MRCKRFVNKGPFLCCLQTLSVDAVQGSEADATVLSLVKTRPDLSAFFVDPRRACVALSRAKHVSIVVGTASVFAGSGGGGGGVKSPDWKLLTAMYKAS